MKLYLDGKTVETVQTGSRILQSSLKADCQFIFSQKESSRPRFFSFVSAQTVLKTFHMPQQSFFKVWCQTVNHETSHNTFNSKKWGTSLIFQIFPFSSIPGSIPGPVEVVLDTFLKSI